jgi:hypothetical protein
MKNSEHKTTRRRFISTTAVAAAGLTIGAQPFNTESYRRAIGAGEKTVDRSFSHFS